MIPPSQQDWQQISKELGMIVKSFINGVVADGCSKGLCQYHRKSKIPRMLPINSQRCMKQLGLTPNSSVPTAEN